MMIRIQKELDCFGSQALITIVQKRDNAQVHQIIEKIIVMVEEFENHFSRFKKDSELTQFNINARFGPQMLYYRKNLKIDFD